VAGIVWVGGGKEVGMGAQHFPGCKTLKSHILKNMRVRGGNSVYK
jgi:hypothetical protein